MHILMKFDKYLPARQLQPYIKYYVVSESDAEQEYNVFPFPGLVIGFQYRGQLAMVDNENINPFIELRHNRHC